MKRRAEFISMCFSSLLLGIISCLYNAIHTNKRRFSDFWPRLMPLLFLFSHRKVVVFVFLEGRGLVVEGITDLLPVLPAIDISFLAPPSGSLDQSLALIRRYLIRSPFPFFFERGQINKSAVFASFVLPAVVFG